MKEMCEEAGYYCPQNVGNAGYLYQSREILLAVVIGWVFLPIVAKSWQFVYTHQYAQAKKRKNFIFSDGVPLCIFLLTH